MDTSRDNIDEGTLDNIKKLRKTGKEIEDMTKPLRQGISDAGKGLFNKGKDDINKFKKSQEVARRATNIDNIRSNKPSVIKQSEVSTKASKFTTNYNKTKEVKVPKPKVTRITPAMKEKAFKQSFGTPTGADWKTGKGTYTPPKNIPNRNLYVDKTGKPTDTGINKYITNRNTKGKFKGADIKPETVSKGLEQTKQDIQNPKIRKSTASQIQSKYGGRRAERVKSPWKKGDFSVPKTNPDVTRARQVGASGMDSNVTGSQKLSTPKATPTPKVSKANKGADALLDKVNSKKRNQLEKGLESKSQSWKNPDPKVDKISNSLSKNNPYRNDVNPGSSIVKVNKGGELIKGKGSNLIKPNNTVTSIVRSNRGGELIKGKGSELVTTNYSRRPKGGPLTVKVPNGSKLTVNKTPVPQRYTTKSGWTNKSGLKSNIHPTAGWARRGLSKQAGVMAAVTKTMQDRKGKKNTVGSWAKSIGKGGVYGAAYAGGAFVGSRFGAPGAAVGGALAQAGVDIVGKGINAIKHTGKSFKQLRRDSTRATNIPKTNMDGWYGLQGKKKKNK
tara:strand:+ start:66 stop:1739 length:1674 start_codon:yes stop_codon:yes gene_type:complete